MVKHTLKIMLQNFLKIWTILECYALKVQKLLKIFHKITQFKDGAPVIQLGSEIYTLKLRLVDLQREGYYSKFQNFHEDL